MPKATGLYLETATKSKVSPEFTLLLVRYFGIIKVRVFDPHKVVCFSIQNAGLVQQLEVQIIDRITC